jgi:hypothetical protein
VIFGSGSQPGDAGRVQTEQFAALNGQLEAVFYAGFLENVHQVHLYGSGGNRKSLSDFFVLQPFANLLHDLLFPGRKPRSRPAFVPIQLLF